MSNQCLAKPGRPLRGRGARGDNPLVSKYEPAYRLAAVHCSACFGDISSLASKNPEQAAPIEQPLSHPEDPTGFPQTRTEVIHGSGAPRVPGGNLLPAMPYPPRLSLTISPPSSRYLTISPAAARQRVACIVGTETRRPIEEGVLIRWRSRERWRDAVRGCTGVSETFVTRRGIDWAGS
jgi:hypothetical protein